VAERSAGTGQGFGRVLVFVYGIFALAATGRSTLQLTTRASEAPVPYALSAFAAVVYIVATFAIATNRRRLALVTVGIEMVGVLIVGLTSLLLPEDYPDATVWSDFGAGYGFIPLVLPVVGLWWLLRQRESRRPEERRDSQG
jgi:cytochrome bd-type quinol oxidase subunit 2